MVLGNDSLSFLCMASVLLSKADLAAVASVVIQHRKKTDGFVAHFRRVIDEDQSGYSFLVASRTACRPAGTMK